MTSSAREGSLAGLRVLEIANIGPSSHAAMLLADMGAEVIRVQRPGEFDAEATSHLSRGRVVVEADLKTSAGIDRLRSLAERADVLIEGFRPGVTERLGIGPQDMLGLFPGLVYARVTGWGQDGPNARKAGHDINFLAPTGILHAMGRAGERPVPPLNLIAGFGAGSMFLVTGILAALWERQSSGQGQVVDVAMADGAALLAQQAWSMRATGAWSDDRGHNLVDGSCPFWDTYECADGKYMAVGAFEPLFYNRLLAALDLDPNDVPPQHDRAQWPTLRSVIADRFASNTRDHWAAIFEDLDACVTPVSSFAEAPDNPHFRARGTFTTIGGVVQPSPVPAFSRTPSPVPTPPPRAPAPPGTTWQ
ncbi:CaiB/BaiF CoA transferase family protein [Nocardia miyunensis]|uniref:CaiB/BaiF CoA transferase family protein n=1 Tax=Nocardia miyunensis TaxID=282684 RepID=UPI000830847B|nr:CaiB/BaiF CoA-transferase family protein [Nocardia miyunensis]